MHRFSLISEVCNLVPKTICLGALLFLLFIVPSKSKVYNNTQGIIKMVPLSYMCVFVLIFLFGDFSRAYIHVYFFFFFAFHMFLYLIFLSQKEEMFCCPNKQYDSNVNVFSGTYVPKFMTSTSFLLEQFATALYSWNNDVILKYDIASFVRLNTCISICFEYKYLNVT